MYSIYVTNKTNRGDIYIRLQHEKLSTANPSFHNDLRNWKDDKGTDVNSHLIWWGFCLIPPQRTMPFAIDLASDRTRKYASLYANYKLWTVDCEINCLRYGCLSVTECRELPNGQFYLTLSNPKPVWIPAKKGEALPTNTIKAGLQAYFGRISTSSGGMPCQVTVSGNQLCQWNGHSQWYSSGEILRDTGHEFVQAKTGDPVPPHAVITGVSKPEGSLFLGRVGGQLPCSISTEGGKIKHFFFSSDKFQSGEILILTNDPSI